MTAIIIQNPALTFLWFLPAPQEFYLIDAPKDFCWKRGEEKILYRFVFLVKVKRIPDRRI